MSLNLIGMPGDSPLLPVQVHGQAAAMFFSPGFAPLLFRDNGPVSFGKYRRLQLRQQDGDVLSAYESVAWGLSVGGQGPADRAGDLLPEPDDRRVDGRPIVGMLGRTILPDDAVVTLDLPARRVAISAPRPHCPVPAPSPLPGSIDMQQDVLLVPVTIDGMPMQAVLELDLPVSILPLALARTAGIDAADLANDPSVVTRFGRGVLGRRHHVKTLDIGDVRLQRVAFDIEEDVRYPMLGLNVFALGRGIFDFASQKFLFRQTTTILPAPTSVHFDQTKIVHIAVEQ